MASVLHQDHQPVVALALHQDAMALAVHHHNNNLHAQHKIHCHEVKALVLKEDSVRHQDHQAAIRLVHHQVAQEVSVHHPVHQLAVDLAATGILRGMRRRSKDAQRNNERNGTPNRHVHE